MERFYNQNSTTQIEWWKLLVWMQCCWNDSCWKLWDFLTSIMMRKHQESCLHLGAADWAFRYPSNPWDKTPDESNRRHRGCRAGANWSERRRKFKALLPLIVIGSVRLLADKIDELWALIRMQAGSEESMNICLKETWLQTHKTDSSDGWRITVLVNNRWCNPGHFTEREHPRWWTVGCGLLTMLSTETVDLFYLATLCVHSSAKLFPSSKKQHSNPFILMSEDFYHISRKFFSKGFFLTFFFDLLPIYNISKNKLYCEGRISLLKCFS